MLVFVLEAMPFLLLGQQLPSIFDGGLGGYSIATALLYAVLVYVVVVGARAAFLFSVPRLHPVFDRLFRTGYPRGAVSLAAALTVPLTTGLWRRTTKTGTVLARENR